MTKVITFEGFIETAPDQEFDMNLLMVHPVRQMTHPGNVGGIDRLIEDCAINLNLGDELKSDPNLDEQMLLTELESVRAGKVPEHILYWKRVVEVDDDPDSEWVYRELERVGA